MNTPNRPTSEPQDHDIGALFEAQSVSVPDGLDSTILAAAKQAVAESPAKPDTTPEKRPATFNRATNRWFALAATVVVGISVAPLLLKAPESSLDAPLADSAEVRAKPATREAGAPVQTAPIVADEDHSFNNGGAAGDLLLEEIESSSASDEAVVFVPLATTALRTESVKTLEKAAAELYRETPDAWMAEILRLQTAGKTNEASTEYKLFRDKHPDIEPDFKLPSQTETSPDIKKP